MTTAAPARFSEQAALQSTLLAPLPEEVRRRVVDEAVPIAAPAGSVLFRPGDVCTPICCSCAARFACS